MNKIHVNKITETVKTLLIDACISLPDDVKDALQSARDDEKEELPREIISQIIQNAEIAKSKSIPICQDTGITTVFVEQGENTFVIGGSIIEAIQQGVRQGTEKGYLRRSIVADPLLRKNTGDNTPAIVYLFPVPGDEIKITVMPKGGGCENMSKLIMLKPADGKDGVKQFILDTVYKSGGNACPPMVIGVGIGGDFSYVPLLAKQALKRKIGQRNNNSYYAVLEKELKTEINLNGQGAQALGGCSTVLDVFIETAPCHIASLPVAVCINCHAARHKSKVITSE